MAIIEINDQKCTYFESYVPNQEFKCVLSTFDGNLVGVAELHYYPQMFDGFYFTRLLVQPKFRKGGFGSAILGRVVEFAKREKINIYNQINPYGELNLEQLTNFYLRHGFQKLREGVVCFLPESNPPR